MKFYNSLKFKLLLVFLCISFIPLISVAIFQLSQLERVTDQNIKSQEIEIANITAKRIESWIDLRDSRMKAILKRHPEFGSVSLDKTNPYFMTILESDDEVEVITILDKDGNSYNPMSKKIESSLAQQDFFKVTKQTKKTYISDIEISPITGQRVINIAEPIMKDNNFAGIIVSVIKVKKFQNYLSDIKIGNTGQAALLSGKGDYIYHPEAKMLGKNYVNVIKNKGMLDVFGKDVLVNNKNYIEYTEDDGTHKVGAYATVPGSGWKVIVSVPAKEVFSQVSKTKSITSILIIIAAIIVSLTSIVFTSYIANPIKSVAANLNTLANADFTGKISQKLLKRKDELGILANALDTMVGSITSVLHLVITESEGVKENAKASSANLMELASEIEEVSATTEELSAGMEETAATTEQMSSTSIEINNAVETIAEKAQNGASIAQEISHRAQELKENALVSEKTANLLRQEVGEDIMKSIEQSKAVEKISGLAEAILQITSQTNLLSLNAAIEAARAGESGKGFAVVAEEMRKLADDSKKTVNEIQGIIKVVVASVQSLTGSSEKALAFIDSTVINDYKTLVIIGEQYFKDAEAIQDMVSDFSATSEELAKSMRSITIAIKEVADSNSEGAGAGQNIAEKALNIMKKTDEVWTLLEKTENISEQLSKAINQFKIV